MHKDAQNPTYLSLGLNNDPSAVRLPALKKIKCESYHYAPKSLDKHMDARKKANNGIQKYNLFTK